MVTVTVGGVEYYIDDKLKKKWDRFREGYLISRDEDRVFLVTGREGVGKSLFTIQQAAYIDPTIINDLSRICFTPDEFRNAVLRAEKGQVVIFDEAFMGLSSKSVLSKTNKKIVDILMKCRQRNLVLFIVIPSFYMLEWYIAVFRSEALFEIKKEKKTNLRYFKCYNYQKKELMYKLGKKGKKPFKLQTRFMGRSFGKYPGGEEFEKAYRLKKETSFKYDDDTDKYDEENKYYKQRDYLFYILSEKMQLSYGKIGELMKDGGFDLDTSGIGKVVRKVMENREKGKENK